MSPPLRPAGWPLLLLLAAAPALAAPPDLAGRLHDHDGLPLLELWGSRTDAAYAHGYLLAEQIVALMDDYMLGPTAFPNPQLYEAFLASPLPDRFTWTPALEAELKALLAGMAAKLGQPPRSSKLNRDLTLADLKAANTLADWHGMMCSTLSVWGHRSHDGQTLTGRNLDFPHTQLMQRSQILMVYRSAAAPQAWVGITWPGLIGVYTAMNDAGVTMLIHDANARGASWTGGFTPRSLTLRQALETTRPPNYVEHVAGVLRSHRVAVGNNIHVSTPVTGNQPPAVVFEYDPNDFERGVTLRTPGETDAALRDAIACTNHLRKRLTPEPGRRYQTLMRVLEMQPADGLLRPADMLKTMRMVRLDTTVHSAVFAPATREMLISIPAIAPRPWSVKLADWLSAEPEVETAAAE
jgi:hypothetical protein